MRQQDNVLPGREQFKRTQSRDGMEENGVEELSHLGGKEGTLQFSLDALKQKKSSVDQVCSNTYFAKCYE